MKELNRICLITLTAGLLAFLAGCSTPSKHGGTPGGIEQTGDGSLPNGSQPPEDLTSIGVPQPARLSGVNPDTDVDYAILAAQTVYFAFDSYTIGASERGKLEEVSKYMTANPGKKLMIAGHADLTGTAEYNRGLGERRALAVRTYLLGLGVPAGQLSTISYGFDRPAINAKGEEAGAKNRRAVPGVITK